MKKLSRIEKYLPIAWIEAQPFDEGRSKSDRVEKTLILNANYFLLSQKPYTVKMYFKA